MRKSQPTKAKKGNIAKADSYAEAFKRMDLAIKARFYIEAIAIQEAIISDRLTSYINYKNPDFLKGRKDFGRLIKEWNKSFKNEGREILEKDLPDLINVWRNARNEAIHGLVKSEPEKNTKRVEHFLSDAYSTAVMGRSLARSVCRWHTKEKTKNKTKQ